MSILTRYILREFFVPLCYCMIGFLGIYILFELFGSFARIVDSDMSFGDCIKYFIGYLSPFFHYLASAAMMLATLYTMWNFCRHSELTAMRASGVSLFAIVKPLVFSSILMGALVLCISEWYMPKYGLWAKQLKSSRFEPGKAAKTAEKSRFSNTKARRDWQIGAHNRDYTALYDVSITDGRLTDYRCRTITAESAMYLDGEWWLTNPTVQHSVRGKNQASSAPHLDALKFRCFNEFDETPKDMFFQNCSPDLISVPQKLKFIESSSNLSEASRRRYYYNAWAQALAPLSCILITLLTIPAGITSGRQSVFSGILAAIGMFFAFHGVSVVCMGLARTELMPPIIAAVAPYLIFSIVAVYFYKNTLRATLVLLGIFLALFLVYAVSAALLMTKAQMSEGMAHALAATMPIMAAIAVLFKLRVRA